MLEFMGFEGLGLAVGGLGCRVLCVCTMVESSISKIQINYVENPLENRSLTFSLNLKSIRA